MGVSFSAAPQDASTRQSNAQRGAAPASAATDEDDSDTPPTLVDDRVANVTYHDTTPLLPPPLVPSGPAEAAAGDKGGLRQRTNAPASAAPVAATEPRNDDRERRPRALGRSRVPKQRRVFLCLTLHSVIFIALHVTLHAAGFVVVVQYAPLPQPSAVFDVVFMYASLALGVVLFHAAGTTDAGWLPLADEMAGIPRPEVEGSAGARGAARSRALRVQSDRLAWNTVRPRVPHVPINVTASADTARRAGSLWSSSSPRCAGSLAGVRNLPDTATAAQQTLRGV